VDAGAFQLLRTAAEYDRMERIFVSPPIKQQLCEDEFKRTGKYSPGSKKFVLNSTTAIISTFV